MTSARCPSTNFDGYWEHDSERDVESVKGACLLVSKTAIERVGLMDEDWFMYGEEMEWCFRIRKAGFRSLFSPEPKRAIREAGDDMATSTPRGC